MTNNQVNLSCDHISVASIDAVDTSSEQTACQPPPLLEWRAAAPIGCCNGTHPAAVAIIRVEIAEDR
jgi:hypothetical protein